MPEFADMQPQDSLLDWIDDVADRFEAEWRTGRPPSLSTYLRDAAGSRRHAMLEELIRIDIEYRRQRGEQRDREDYAAEFTELCGPPGARLPSPNGEKLPRTLGPYELIDVLGRGGFGTVYKARDRQLNRWVAIKAPHAGALDTTESRVRFLREARSAAQLTHPAIVPVHAVARDGDVPYIVSEYIEARTLAEVLADRRLSWRNAAELTAHIADALDYAHRRHVVHRDIKPQNILIDAQGQPHIADFGLAQYGEASTLLTREGDLLGTPAYMSPEQAAGQSNRVDGRSDLYSVGVVLYKMLTGEAPFQGNARMMLHQVLTEEPRPPRQLNDQIPRDLQTICLKMLSKEPQRRYSTAAACAADLRRFLNGEPILARPVSRTERAWRWCRRNPLAAGLACAVLLALLAGTAISSYFAVEAVKEKERTNQAKEISDERLYLAQMRLTQQAWEDGTTDWFLELLEGQRPEQTGGIDRRGFEWHYWDNLCHVDVVTLQDHMGNVAALSFSPDGARLASASGDGAVRIWDTKTRRVLLTLPSPVAGAVSVAFSPDGKHLAAPAADHTVWIWDALTGAAVRRLTGHQDVVVSIAYSPDGTRLVSASGDRTVQIWDADDGRQMLRLENQRVRNVVFSPNGNLLAASGGDDRTVKVWDANDGRLVRTFDGHTGTVRCVAFHPQGRLLASADGDAAQPGEIKVWDLDRASAILNLREHRLPVESITYSRDGKLLASAGMDGTLRVWDTGAGSLLRTLKGHRGQVRSVAFNPDGHTLASGSVDGTIRIWGDRAGRPAVTLRGHTDHVHAVVFGPDGRQVVSASQDHTVRLWDADTGHERAVMRGHTDSVNGVAFSPDGRTIASVGHDQVIHLWDAVNETEPRLLHGHTAMIWCAAFSPSGKYLASASADGTVRVWDAASGQIFRTLPSPNGPAGWTRSIAIDPTSARLAAPSGAADILIWDIADVKQLLTLKGHTETVWCAVYSPDGKTLASGSNDDTVRLWDANKGHLLRTFKGHTNNVTSVAFSPDGRRLASASWDKTVKLWDIASGQEVLTLKGHSERVFSVAFSPDGRRLASASLDGTVRIWDATPRAK